VRVVKHVVAPRVLRICITGVGAEPPESKAQLEAAIDQDLIAHGLDPTYGMPTPASLTAAG